MADGINKMAVEDMSGEPQPLDVERFSAEQVTLLATDAQCGLLFSSYIPAADEAGNMGIATHPTVFVSIPPKTAKRLAGMLTNFIKQYEEDHGVIGIPTKKQS